MNNNNLNVSKYVPPPSPTLDVRQIPKAQGQSLNVQNLLPPPPLPGSIN